jgi:phosphatidylglycerophosphate synthase
VVTTRRALAVGLAALAAILAALAATVGLGLPAWGVGLGCGVLLMAAVAGAMPPGDVGTLGPADLVTLSRSTLACAVAALVADALLGHPAVRTLVALASVALVLDAVDGWVARRTGSASAFGARFDGEADAFLILVLSVYVAATLGGWVLAIGAARYVFAAAGWLLAWLRLPLPFRYWRKVVAATQGVVLTVAAADVAPGVVVHAAVAVALAMLAESFGRDVLWAWRHRSAPLPAGTAPAPQLRLQVP